MRKLNVFLAAGMLAFFLAHAIMGANRLFGGSAAPAPFLAWAAAGFAAAHIAVSSVLTGQTLYAMKRSGAGYFKENRLFWARRISGFAAVIPLLTHLFIFTNENAEVFRLREFTVGRLVSQLLLVAALGLHVLTNVRPFMNALGAKGGKGLAADSAFVISILLLIFAAAFAVYYVRWALN